MGVWKFETFEIIEDETIDEMYSRLTLIVNELKYFGKTCTPHERIRKKLRSLHKIWRPMVTTITKTKDLKSIVLQPTGFLRSHEVILQEDIKREKCLLLQPLKTALKIPNSFV